MRLCDVSAFGPCANRFFNLVTIFTHPVTNFLRNNLLKFASKKHSDASFVHSTGEPSNFTLVNTNTTGCDILFSWARLTIRTRGTDFSSVRCCCSSSVCAPSALRAISSAPTWSTVAQPHLHEPQTNSTAPASPAAEPPPKPKLNPKSRLSSPQLPPRGKPQPRHPQSSRGSLQRLRPSAWSRSPASSRMVPPSPPASVPYRISAAHLPSPSRFHSTQ